MITIREVATFQTNFRLIEFVCVFVRVVCICSRISATSASLSIHCSCCYCWRLIVLQLVISMGCLLSSDFSIHYSIICISGWLPWLATPMFHAPTPQLAGRFVRLWWNKPEHNPHGEYKIHWKPTTCKHKHKHKHRDLFISISPGWLNSLQINILSDNKK